MVQIRPLCVAKKRSVELWPFEWHFIPYVWYKILYIYIYNILYNIYGCISLAKYLLSPAYPPSPPHTEGGINDTTVVKTKI